MLLFRALGALFAAALVAAQHPPTVVVVFPNLMRFDSPEEVIIDYSSGVVPASCSVSLQNYPDREKTFSASNVVVASGAQGKVLVMTKLTDLVQGSLSTLNYAHVYVRVQCSPLGFNKEAVVLLTGTKGYLFLQTDKPIYHPKEDVAIRAISLNPDMLPANTDFTMDILNPKQTIFERFEGKADKGFFSKKINLPDVTILGNWSVRASYKNQFQSQSLISNVSFEVREYVLPTFSVNIKTPNFILPSDKEVQVTVTARYVFKEDVKGRLTIVFSLVKTDGSSQTIKIITFSDFHGERIVALPKDDFRKWFPDVGSRLAVDATVTEEASGNQETNSDSSAMFVKSPYLVSFEKTTKYFKPGLPYNLELALKYANGGVAGGVSIEVSVTVKERDGNHRVNVFMNDTEGEQFITDEEGLLLKTLDTDANAEYLKVKVKTVDDRIPSTEGVITLKPQTTARNNFLSIQLKFGRSGRTSRIPVGKRLEIRVDFTENVNKHVTFMVLTRGKVVSSNSLAVNGNSIHKNIDITPQMAPRARLVVYYVSGGYPPEVIADSIVLDVDKTCKEELEIKQDKDNYRPKDVVGLTIKSAADSMVSLLAVDKAVYLLSERDILSRDKMFNTIMDLDLGCGAGSGSNVGEVFRDSGLHVLTNRANLLTPRRMSPECKQKIRKRRAAERVRRGIHSNNRIIDTLNKYNSADRACCEEGLEKQQDQRSCSDIETRNMVNGTCEFGLDQRSCVDIAQYRNMVNGSCRDALLHCCQLEKDANMPSGRSGADDEEEINENDISIDRREDFPETWINELYEMRSAQETLSRPLPDSITTWIISGVSVSPSAGMCVAKAINVTAKKEFFVHADLPYAAVRGEQLEVKATVYNFGDHQITTLVWMEGNRNKLCFVGNSEGRTHKQRVVLEAKTGQTVTFPVVPLEVGDIDIKVTAITQFTGDQVTRKLKCVAEGVTRYATFSTRLDPDGIMGRAGSGGASAGVMFDIPNKRQMIEIPLKFPGDAIPGTKVCSVAISGSLLGTMVPSNDLNMTHRIRQPYGCGEQTMATMGPLVYSTRYMLRTNTLTAELEQNAYKFIFYGFQRALTFKHLDGSYSIYPKVTSSSWLTAFVTKVFCQASQFSNIGTAVAPHAMAAINWLLENAQWADGSFHENRSASSHMFGQNMRNDVTFTAFVVEAISKCGNVDGIDITSGGIATKLRTSVDYLVQNRNSQNNPYDQAILTYALALQNNPHRFAANVKLRGMSNLDPVTGMRYWNQDGSVVPENTTPTWYKRWPSALAIEAASYALLAQLELGGRAEDYFQYAGPIASWLIRQRKITGFFVSTTDTVNALEALSDYALRADSKCDLNMHVRVFSNSGNDMPRQNFHLIKADAYNPYTITENLPIDGKLSIIAEGTGIGEVQVECQYNSPEKEGEVCTFALNVTSEEENVPVEELNKEIKEVKRNQPDGRPRDADGVTKFVNEIKIEFSYIGAGTNVGMSILDVTLFSGFSPVLLDLKSLEKNGVIDRYEVVSSSVLMYIGEVRKGVTTTVTFRAKQDQVVKDVQPAAVKLYDYYEPDMHHCTKFYHPQQNSPLLATICDKNEEGRKVCQCAASACTEFWGFKEGARPHLKTRDTLKDDACIIHEYAIKIRAGPTEISEPLSKMNATVELDIKAGTMPYSVNDKMQFVWNAKCKNPSFTVGTSYLVMGKDGAKFVEENGRESMRYVLDSSSFVVEWYGPNKPRYHRALTMFANELINDGCGQ